MSDDCEIIITAVGDVSFAGGLPVSFDNINSWISEDVKSEILGDIKIVNMEYVLIPDGAEKPSGLKLAEYEYSLNALYNAGFNVIVLGNNHIYDYNNHVGLLNTINRIKDIGLYCCGAGANIYDAKRPVILEVKNKKIAIFSRVHSPSFENVKPILAGSDKSGIVQLDIDDLYESINILKNNGKCDIAILYAHWGYQYIHYTPPSIKRIIYQLLEANVDLILGSHAHVLQGIYKHNRKFAASGLGNFYFYPFEYHDGSMERILYGTESKVTRQSAITRFTYKDDYWKIHIIPTIQTSAEIIEKNDIIESNNIKKNMTFKLNRYNDVSFFFCLRKNEILNILPKGNICSILQKIINLIINPKKIFAIVKRVLLSPKHR